MFQSFDDVTDPTVGAPRVAALRAELEARGLTGFLVPRADEHQGEYVPAAAQRLAWLTGFTGSAGLAIVLSERAAIFIDGRYTLQVRQQVDEKVFEICHLVDEPPTRWLTNTLKPGDRLGYDPWLHTLAEVRRFRKAVGEAGAELVAVDANPVDSVWEDRPAPPLGPVEIQEEALAGRSSAEKLTEIAEALGKVRADAAVITDPASIAWIFNIRGRDVPHTPLPLSFAILSREGRPRLFIDGRKLSNAVRDHLESVVEIAEPDAFHAGLAALGAARARVLVDADGAAEAVERIVRQAGGSIVEGRDPCLLPKARKNAAEIAGARSAHHRDAVAVCRFLAWFDREAPKGALDEIGAVEALERFRAETGALIDVSFETIAGAGPNAALPHYRVSRASNRRIEAGTIFLIDSGAQYRDGTTDITRTMIVGEADAEMRDRFTRVLKGHIAIATARFPERTTGAQLDPFARRALWDAGLDFDHGTGHGVGSFLSVHEGPARISKLGHTPLEAGMILSNEPGFYKSGHWGIRIENLVLVREAEMLEGGDRPVHSFETLTLAPIDRRLIERALLTPAERAWLDAYHARVREEIGPVLDPETRTWLEAATAPLG